MFTKAQIITFAILFALSLFAAVLVSNDFVALGIVLFLLLITSSLVIQDIWKSSEETKQRMLGEELEYRYHAGQFESVVRSLKMATKYSPWSRREIAFVLREALLNKYAESKDYPAHWIYTESGRDTILQILGPSNGDLLDILEPSDKPPIRNFLRSRQDHLYLPRLRRALHLVETDIDEHEVNWINDRN